MDTCLEPEMRQEKGDFRRAVEFAGGLGEERSEWPQSEDTSGASDSTAVDTSGLVGSDRHGSSFAPLPSLVHKGPA